MVFLRTENGFLYYFILEKGGHKAREFLHREFKNTKEYPAQNK